jgi:hypothetical protein
MALAVSPEALTLEKEAREEKEAQADMEALAVQ